MNRQSRSRVFCAIGVVLTAVVVAMAPPANAQGVTTGLIAGVVADSQGGVVPGATVTAVHQPSGTSYEGVSQADGRFTLPGVRVGGPYTVTAMLTGFSTEIKN